MLRSIRSRLVLLVLAVLVPALAAAGWAAFSTYQRQKASAEQTLRETAKALALVVDRELEQREAIVRVLATSPSLAFDDLKPFYQQARSATENTGERIILSNRHGPVLDTSRSFDAPLTEQGAEPARALVQQSGVSSLPNREGGAAPLLSIDVPVSRSGEPWNLSLMMPSTQLQRVIQDQGLPQGWTAAVLDRNGIVVARQPEPERWVGSPAHPTLRDRVSRLSEGFYETVTLDGTEVIAFFSKSPRYGWAFAIGVPRVRMRQSMQDALLQVGAVALVLTLLSVLAAIWVGRGLAQPLRALHDAAKALERGERVRVPASGLQESDEVAGALAHAAERILDANQVLEARVAEAVAEARTAQQKLLQSQKLEAVGQLTGGIAHDFNNLLQTLSAGQQLLGRLTQSPEAKKILESCDRAIHKAAKLTRQLLAFGRRQAFRPAPIDLRDQVLGMRDLLAGSLRDDIELTVDFAPDLWPAFVDATQLELAILNCAMNARDAMPSAGELSIRARNVVLQGNERADNLRGDFIALSIEDTGEGIPAELLAKVFEPFFTTKEVGKGSGLGLAQVYGFATQSRGAVEIASEVGRGTMVTMLLPRAQETAADRRRIELQDACMAGRGRKVLFVEDDVLVADVVASALRGLGFELIQVANGDKAMEVLQSDVSLDVVFSDVVMPGRTNGYDLARAAMKLRPAVKVVLATGYSDKGTAVDNVTVLAKPYTIAALTVELLAEKAD